MLGIGTLSGVELVDKLHRIEDRHPSRADKDASACLRLMHDAVDTACSFRTFLRYPSARPPARGLSCFRSVTPVGERGAEGSRVLYFLLYFILPRHNTNALKFREFCAGNRLRMEPPPTPGILDTGVTLGGTSLL